MLELEGATEMISSNSLVFKGQNQGAEKPHSLAMSRSLPDSQTPLRMS